MISSKRIIRISYFTMLTVLGAFIKIPVGSVNFTLQTLFIVLSGFVLGATDGFFAQIAYIFLGIIGLPVFSNGGGFSYALQPSFGYIIGFPFCAFIAGFTIRRLRTLSTLKIWLCGILSLLPVYLLGAIYQVLILIFVNGLSLTASFISLVSIVIYFVVDAILIFIVALLYPRLTGLLKLHTEESA